MPDDERQVAGLWCGEVLEALPDYLEDTLPADVRVAVEAHLRGCDWCARFGGEYSAVVTALREKLGAAEPAPAGVLKRLRERLSRETG